MASSDLAERVGDVLKGDPDHLEERAREEAAVLKSELRDGTFDNPQAIVGLEYEFAAVDAESGALMRVPRRLLEYIGFEKELGLHNAELTTSPQPLNGYGLLAQEAAVTANLAAALSYTRTEGIRLVSDGIFTIPPAGESATSYLTDSVEDGGIRIAANMSESVRYHAMANPVGATPRMQIDAPNVRLAADTVMPESLITSIQPHYQVPHAPDLPSYFRYALRIAGPLLALGVNSPFFPPDLYDDGVSPDDVLADGWMEHRIAVFESVMNESLDEPGKVRFPRDVASVEEAVDRIVEDDTLASMPISTANRFDDAYAHFLVKHGTYWRWVRPVFDGATRSAANARIEFRPIPAQPTIRGSIAFQATVAGLLESFVRRDHPVIDLEWSTARENFYGAMRNGLDADMRWIMNDGTETSTTVEIYDDLFDHAVDGLELRGLSGEETERYVWPLRQRVRHGLTPARWKRRLVRERLDEGATLEEAISAMQRTYFDRQKRTLLEGSFTDWIDDRV